MKTGYAVDIMERSAARETDQSTMEHDRAVPAHHNPHMNVETVAELMDVATTFATTAAVGGTFMLLVIFAASACLTFLGSGRPPGRTQRPALRLAAVARAIAETALWSIGLALVAGGLIMVTALTFGPQALSTPFLSLVVAAWTLAVAAACIRRARRYLRQPRD